MKKTRFRSSYRRHQRQRFWQIIFPLLLVGALLLAVAVGALLGGMARASLWADAALIWLLFPWLALLLLPLALTVAAIVGLARLLGAAPMWFAGRQRDFERLAAHVRRWSNRTTKPFVQLAGWRAGWQRVLKRIRGKR